MDAVSKDLSRTVMPRKLCQSIHYYVNYHQFERLENPVAGGYKYLSKTQDSAFLNFSMRLVTRKEMNKTQYFRLRLYDSDFNALIAIVS